jgi:hypothetical protein
MRVVFTIMLTFLLAISASGQDPDISETSDDNGVKRSENRPIGNDFGIYVGYGLNSPGCSQCYQDPWTGGWLVGMKLGVIFPKKFTIGIISQFWMQGSDLWKNSANIEYKRNSIYIHLAGYFYPLRKPDFFLKGSAGINFFNFTPVDSVRLDNGRQTMSTLRNVGLGFSVGLGYTLKITKKVDLIPSIDYLYQPFRQLKGEYPYQVVSGTSGSHNLYISLGLTSHIFDDDP